MSFTLQRCNTSIPKSEIQKRPVRVGKVWRGMQSSKSKMEFTSFEPWTSCRLIGFENTLSAVLVSGVLFAHFRLTEHQSENEISIFNCINIR